MKTVIYIHGFGSSGFGTKAQIFREHFHRKGVRFLAPSLSYVPELAVTTLCETVEVCGVSEVVLTGSSMGGFYAAWLAHRYGIRAVLINPAMTMVQPFERLLGLQRNYYDGSRFEWTQAHYDMLKKYRVQIEDAQWAGLVLLLLQEGDEVLDHRVTLDIFRSLPKDAIIAEPGGNHAFVNIEKHMEKIDAFLGV